MKTNNLETLENLKNELLDLIREKENEIYNFELDSSDYEDSYCDMLDECYPELFNMLPSRILSECDPIAYSCGLNDYVDSLDNEDNEDYIVLTEELEELNNELEELEDQINELEEEENE